MNIQQEFDSAAYKTELMLLELRRLVVDAEPLSNPQEKSLKTLTELLQSVRLLARTSRGLFVPDSPEKFLRWAERNQNKPGEDSRFDSVAYQTELQLLELRGLIWEEEQVSDTQHLSLATLTELLGAVKQIIESLQSLFVLEAGQQEGSSLSGDASRELSRLEQQIASLPDNSSESSLPEDFFKTILPKLYGRTYSRESLKDVLTELAKHDLRFMKILHLYMDQAEQEYNDRNDDTDERMDGSPPVPAAPIKPPPMRTDGAARTFAEAEEPPRNP